MRMGALLCGIILASQLVQASTQETPVEAEARIQAEMDALIDRTGHISPESASEAIEIARKGVQAHDRGEYGKAIELYRKALEKNPLFDTAYYEMAYSYSASGDQRGALEAITKAVALNPKAEHSLILRASILDDLGYPDDAVAAYLRVLDLQPRSFEALLNLAITYIRQKKLDKGEEALIKAREIRPDHPSPLLHLANIAAARNENYEEEKFLNEFVRVGEKDPRLPAVKERLKRLTTVQVNIRTDLADGNPAASAVELAEQMQRALWRSSKHREAFPEAKSYFPTFEEEKDVAETALAMWKESKRKPGAKHPRYDFLLAVEEQGFLTEYIWYANEQKLGQRATDWLAQNSERITTFVNWAKRADYSSFVERAVPKAESEQSALHPRDLPALVLKACQESKLSYEIGVSPEPADCRDFISQESERFQKVLKRSGANCLTREDVAKRLDSLSGRVDEDVLLQVFRLYLPGENHWTEAARMTSRLARQMVDSAWPRAGEGSVERRGDKIKVKASGAPWLAYYLAKAAWRNEPELRARFAGPGEDVPALAEEWFALVTLVGAYANSKESAGRTEEKPQSAEGKPEDKVAVIDPFLENLTSATNSELLVGFGLFEVLHKRYGVPLNCLDARQAEVLAKYYSAFVLQPVTQPAR
jgi:tetratricopeptide (TPR) repeat protein